MRNLGSLIAACGGTPGPGKSFKNDVTGAGPGVKFSDYHVEDWSFSGSVPAGGPVYPDGQVFNMTVSLTRGAKASLIQRGGDVVTVTNLSVRGARADIVSNIDVASGTGTVDLTMRSPYNPSASATASAWYASTTYPNKPPATDDMEIVKWTPSLVNASGTGTGIANFRVSYVPDNGNYNPDLYVDYSLTMQNRAETLNDWEFRWYSDPDYTVLVSSGQTATASTTNGQTVTYYLQARRIGDPEWTNVGAFPFTDSRP